MLRMFTCVIVNFFVIGLACLSVGPLIDSINCLSCWLNNLSSSLFTSTLLLFLMLLLSFPPIFFFWPASVAYQDIAILHAASLVYHHYSKTFKLEYRSQDKIHWFPIMFLALLILLALSSVHLVFLELE